MFTILHKRELNKDVYKMDVIAPLVCKKAKAGQFVILRVDEHGERIPLTIADKNSEEGTVSVIFHAVGASTMKLAMVEEHGTIADFVGPLGKATDTENKKKVCVIGGGVGCAIAYPVAKAMKEHGAEVVSVIGFRNKDLLILEDEFKAVSDRLVVMTDDGSYGEKGNVCLPLETMLESGETFDEVITIGPLIMMKFVAETTRKYGVKTIASMNPIMIDGTGMCGGCRLTVEGKMKFACVDGPEFDAHEIDFDEAMMRNNAYQDFEKKAREETCNLFSKEVE